MRAYHRPRVDMLRDFFQHHQSTRAAIYLWIHARRRPNFIITCVWRVRDLPVDSLTLYQGTHWNDFPGGDGIFVSRSILNSLAPLIVFFPFLSTVNVKAFKTFDNQRLPPKKYCNLSTQTEGNSCYFWCCRKKQTKKKQTRALKSQFFRLKNFKSKRFVIITMIIIKKIFFFFLPVWWGRRHDRCRSSTARGTHRFALWSCARFTLIGWSSPSSSSFPNPLSLLYIQLRKRGEDGCRRVL